MNIIEATTGYEHWLAGHTRLIPADLKRKHARMAESAFPFLRATFYRWIQLWPKVCPKLTGAPRTLAVGDLHIENFGTWRDAEGRLAWGINDFDEAFELPNTNDLVRLAASALLAINGEHLKLAGVEACDSILEGYTKGIREGGRPFVLAEDHAWLSVIVDHHRSDPAPFWKRIDDGMTAPRLRPPVPIAAILRKAMPAGCRDFHCGPRVAGMGSLGKPRFVGMADLQGGLVAREDKVLTPSACTWALGKGRTMRSKYQEILRTAVRCPDPHLQVKSGLVIRRLAPDSRKVELSAAGGVGDEARLLRAMGRETANVHLGSRGVIRAIRRDLARRSPDWLRSAARDMKDATMEDWDHWRGVFRPA